MDVLERVWEERGSIPNTDALGGRWGAGECLRFGLDSSWSGSCA
jgi:hypothetical protein